MIFIHFCGFVLFFLIKACGVLPRVNSARFFVTMMIFVFTRWAELYCIVIAKVVSVSWYKKNRKDVIYVDVLIFCTVVIWLTLPLGRSRQIRTFFFYKEGAEMLEFPSTNGLQFTFQLFVNRLWLCFVECFYLRCRLLCDRLVYPGELFVTIFYIAALQVIDCHVFFLRRSNVHYSCSPFFFALKFNVFRVFFVFFFYFGSAHSILCQPYE